MRFLITLSVLVLLSCSFAIATETGNIQIVGSASASLQTDSLAFELDHSLLRLTKSSSNALVFWSVATGVHTLAVRIAGDTIGSSCTFTIYPGLTNRLALVKATSGLQLADDGFADQSAPMLTFDSRTLNNLPGEFTDGVGIFAGGPQNSTRYNWEGLSYRSPGWSWDQSPTLKGAPFSALVNFGDPFAGYDNADISMFSEADSVRYGDIQFTYATRDQRRFRENSNTPLMHGKGVLAVSFAGENSADASPRWNVDSILPHNNTKNGEMAIKFRYDDNSKSRFDLLFLEKHNERLYYLQPYHFDYIHAPKEKTVSLRGQANYQYTARPDLIFTAGAGWSLDDRKYGDGVAFDNLQGYVRYWPDLAGQIMGNPLSEPFGIFYSWDDLHGIYDTIFTDSSTSLNEAHFLDQYLHNRTTTILGTVSAQKLFGSHTSLMGRLQLNSSRVRSYHHQRPTIGDYSPASVNAFGMDSLGVVTDADGNGIKPPSPTTLVGSMQLHRISASYFAKLSLEIVHFDPGYQMPGDLQLPINEEKTTFWGVRTDPEFLTNARSSTRFGYRAGIGARADSNLSVFANASLRYEIPDYDLLYSGLNWLRSSTGLIGSQTPILGNPELKPIEHRLWMLGMTAHKSNLRASIAAFYRYDRNYPAVHYYDASPHSFGMYVSGDQNYNNHTSLFGVTAAAGGIYHNYLWGHLTATYTNGTHPVDSIYLYSIGYYQSGLASFGEYADFCGAASVGIDFGRINGHSSSSLGKICRMFSAAVTGRYHTGVRYAQTAITDELSPATPAFYDFKSDKMQAAKAFIEFNLSISARIVDSKALQLGLRLDILNLLNRSNVLGVYQGTGLPDDDGWLGTPGGQFMTNEYSTPRDNSGLNYEQKYRLAMNDPNHFSRPRMIRIAAIMGF